MRGGFCIYRIWLEFGQNSVSFQKFLRPWRFQEKLQILIRQKKDAALCEFELKSARLT